MYWQICEAHVMVHKANGLKTAEFSGCEGLKTAYLKMIQVLYLFPSCLFLNWTVFRSPKEGKRYRLTKKKLGLYLRHGVINGSVLDS